MLACLSLFRINTAQNLQYRLAGLVGALTSAFWGLIEILIYHVFFIYGANNDARLTLSQTVSYMWLTQSFIWIQARNVNSDILGKINSGDVGVELCRPLDLYFHWFAKTASSLLSPTLLRGIPVLLPGLLAPSGYRLSAPDSIVGLGLMLLSLTCALLLCTAFGMFATAIRMNVQWGDGPVYIVLLISALLSGGYFPLQLWPDFLQGFLLFQPFAGYLDIPLRLYLGTMPLSDAAGAIALQLLWTAVFVAAGRVMMSRRLKMVVIQGG